MRIHSMKTHSGKTYSGAAALILFGVLSSVSAAQGVGTSIPDEIVLEDLSGTRATSFDQFQGRAILIEFFAYW